MSQLCPGVLPVIKKETNPYTNNKKNINLTKVTTENPYSFFVMKDRRPPILSLSIGLSCLIVGSPSAIRNISTSKTNRRFISNQLV